MKRPRGQAFTTTPIRKQLASQGKKSPINKGIDPKKRRAVEDHQRRIYEEQWFA